MSSDSLNGINHSQIRDFSENAPQTPVWRNRLVTWAPAIGGVVSAGTAAAVFFTVSKYFAVSMLEIGAPAIGGAFLLGVMVGLLIKCCFSNRARIAPELGDQEPVPIDRFPNWQMEFRIAMRAQRKEDSQTNRTKVKELFEEGEQNDFLFRPGPGADKQTAAHTCAMVGSSALMSDLIRAKNSDFSLVDESWGNTPLHWAIANANNENAWEMLEAFGPDFLNITIIYDLRKWVPSPVKKPAIFLIKP